MTKFNVRVLTMAYLNIEAGDRFLDIGAGTGSVGIQAGTMGAKVVAIERAELGVKLIEENAEAFGVDVKVIHGTAPADLPSMELDKVFIGGSRGQLGEIFNYIDENLVSGGMLVANFILIKNLHEFMELLKEHGYEDIEMHLVQTSTMDRIGLMKADNPIYIVRGVKR